jgi:hypothetical protein
MSRLRVVQPGDGTPEMGFAEAARAALEKALADGATVLMIAYETPGAMRAVSVPDGIVVVKGFVELLWEAANASDADDK